MITPSTVTEAVVYLRGEGYTDDIEAQVKPDGNALACARTGSAHTAAEAVVEHTFRFEGDSDPGDEAIVLGLSFPSAGIRGVLVSAYGPGADAATAEFLATLHP